MQYLTCQKCGNLVELVRDGGEELCCCGEKMQRIDKKGSSVSENKHTPKIMSDGRTVTVSLAEGDHPMTGEHYIGWIALSTDRGVQRRAFKPSDTPTAHFPIEKGENPREAVAFCNLHGMWYKTVDPQY